jgi:hypothetical protein
LATRGGEIRDRIEFGATHVFPRALSPKRMQSAPVLCVLLLCRTFIHAHLVTDGPRLLDASTHARVRLRCVNWYGAHQEPLVPGGLELTSATAIADLIANGVGANCVRIPLSDHTVLYNSAVEGRFVLPGAPVRALEVLDSVVSALTSRNLMVILNSHTSVPGWVGSNEAQPQGLWHYGNLSTADWASALALVAGRYASNALVVGIDLRNEIHDQDGVTITWGESEDVQSDWLAAASMADSAIAAVNPNVLIIVSGLCRGYDLRAMVDRPGPAAALQRGRLVYSTHVYVFSWWWRYVETTLVLEVTAGCLVCIVVLITLVLMHWWDELPVATTLLGKSQRTPAYDQLVAVPVASFLPFACGWLWIALEKASLARTVGCATVAAEAEPWMIAGAVLLGLSALALGWVVCMDGCSFWLDGLLCALGWACLMCVAVIVLCCVADTYWMVCNELGRWRLDARAVPVWVGEFGTVMGDASKPWGLLVRFLQEHDLDFAYWALNGRMWRDGGWVNEGFGLLDETYSAVRDPAFAGRLFRL